MPAILDFLIQNYVLFILLMGAYIITTFDVFLGRSMITLLRCTLLMIAALVIFDSLEEYTATFTSYTPWRVLFSALCYSLRPLIIMMLVFLIRKKTTKWIIAPAVLNALIAFSAFFSRISYYFDNENHFQRGFLGVTPYVVTIFYVLVLFIISIRALTVRSSEEGVVMLFLSITAVFASLLAFSDHGEVINLTYGAETVLYYLYIYAMFTKRDALTGLYNRQSLYGDVKKNRHAITGVVSIDMNELKWMNDTLGHAAGDKALQAIAAQLVRPASSVDYAYRIGGDEFIMLSRGRNPEQMKDLVEAMRQGVTEAGYSCAFGLSCEGSVEDMFRVADLRMYEDKARIKEENARRGSPMHLRS